MISTVVIPASIPDFVHPPVPGESHELYGDSHLESIKLPALAVAGPTINRPRNSHSNSLSFSDPLSLDSSTCQGSGRTSSLPNSSHPVTISRNESVHELIGASPAADAEHSSDAIAWVKLVEACTQGHSELVQEIIEISPSLKDSIDNISSATGMNPLHFAAARGHSEVVRILIDQAGAGADIQDREGETALLKASYSGSLPTVCFLLKRGANVHQRDKDGWTALHNASSRGYIDIAQVLLEKGEADVNARSKMGHTPLINAASKGDVAMVLYFLNHAKANPLLKNAFSEAAYDVAAANSEAYLCDILQSSEKQWWKVEHSNEPQYDVQATHSTVLLVVHENQRAIGSFPLSFMAPKFAASALTQQDICGPWSLPSGRPSTKDDVHLPLLTVPGASQSSRANIQRGWFWLTEWVVDKTDPSVDNEGWQYGKSLTELSQVWTANAPSSGGNWVRRRKWIRVMKKRVDMDKTGPSIEDDLMLDGHKTDLPQESISDQGDYIKRANLALRADEGFADVYQEFRRYRQAIQILLRGVKADRNFSTKSAATALVQEHLEHSEMLSETIQNLNSMYHNVSDLETPIPQIASSLTQGNPGSPNELRSLTLLKSRPSDVDVDSVEELQSTPYSELGHSGHHDPPSPSETPTISADHSHLIQEHGEIRAHYVTAQECHEHGGRTSEPDLEHVAVIESVSEMNISSDVSTGTEIPSSGTNFPVSSQERIVAALNVESEQHSIPQDRPVTPQNITTSSPMSSNTDPFPMARLTRSPRAATPSSVAGSSNTASSSGGSTPLSAPPPQHFAQHLAAIAASNPAVDALSSSLGSQHDDATPDTRSGLANPSRARPPVVTATSLPPPCPSIQPGTNYDSNGSSVTNQVSASTHRRHSQQTAPQHDYMHQHQPQQSPQSSHSLVLGPLPGAKWESDYKAIECRECRRKFSLWLRRHHCRRCGHVVCDRCSSHRATLHPSMVVYDPSSSEAFINHQTTSRRGTLQNYRVCDSCHGTLGPGLRSQSIGPGTGTSSSATQPGAYLAHHRSYHGQQSMSSRHFDSQRNSNFNNGVNSTIISSSYGDNGGVYLSHGGDPYSGDFAAYSSSRSSSSSNIHQPTAMVRNGSSSSLMSECPVCGAILAGLEGGKAAQELHVQDCLEGKPGQGGGPINNVRYIGK
ncbi:hypothetical protein BG004_007011 [Podila humilis]|nr:hypothetical protein BG004_007011 [Podila humilis]